MRASEPAFGTRSTINPQVGWAIVRRLRNPTVRYVTGAANAGDAASVASTAQAHFSLLIPSFEAIRPDNHRLTNAAANGLSRGRIIQVLPFR